METSLEHTLFSKLAQQVGSVDDPEVMPNPEKKLNNVKSRGWDFLTKVTSDHKFKVLTQNPIIDDIRDAIELLRAVNDNFSLFTKLSVWKMLTVPRTGNEHFRLFERYKDTISPYLNPKWNRSIRADI